MDILLERFQSSLEPVTDKTIAAAQQIAGVPAANGVEHTAFTDVISGHAVRTTALEAE